MKKKHLSGEKYFFLTRHWKGPLGWHQSNCDIIAARAGVGGYILLHRRQASFPIPLDPIKFEETR
jgi:hypothetical protein